MTSLRRSQNISEQTETEFRRHFVFKKRKHRNTTNTTGENCEISEYWSFSKYPPRLTLTPKAVITYGRRTNYIRASLICSIFYNSGYELHNK